MHLTIRMAWHDNNWDGTICKDPKQNVYCVGSNSLLSDRLRKNRDLKLEMDNAGKKIDSLGDYLPPCYWSSNAFSADTANIWHKHPLMTHKKINGKQPSYSVFTWPFKISFTDDDEKEIWGKYPPENVVEKRLDKLESKLTSGDSLAFFYLNYSNPISPDYGQYVLVGCAPIVDITRTGKFDLSDKELKETQKKYGDNFSALNWAIQVSYDFKENGVMLPYSYYLKHISKHPSHEYMLDEMQVLIDDDMSANFKYVAMGMNDDASIYLLTKLRKSLAKVKEHGILPDTYKIDAQSEQVDNLLRKAWQKRGIYPGLGNVLDVIGDVDENGVGDEIVSLIKSNSGSKDVLGIVFSILSGKSDIPDYLKKYSDLKEMIYNPNDYDFELLKKLSLFSLTSTQISSILNGEDGISLDHEEIISNPYTLCEEYDFTHLKFTPDKISINDVGIPLFMIDIGMFPDNRFLDRNGELQDLKPNAPQRIRAIVRECLKSMGTTGDCFASLDDILDYIKEHPLFFKEKPNINKKELVSESSKYASHFEGNLIIKHSNGADYFYLKEIWDAEQRIANGVRVLLERSDHKCKDAAKINLTNDIADLSKKIQGFPKDDFVQERQHLMEGIMSKSLYVVTGIPGSGKTKALEVVINRLKHMEEKVTLLAPTGKAALRLGNGAKTIDRLIYEYKYNDILDDPRKIADDTRRHLNTENLIIDESSMLDLKKLDVLFRMITDSQGKITVKRLVFVGDPNQLPPIGYGKPFSDIIKMLNKEHQNSNFIQLQVNCRQDDQGITDITRVFEYGKDYDASRLARIASGDYTSNGFKSISWKDQDDLEKKIGSRLCDIFKENKPVPPNKTSKLNRLFGLDNNGYVRDRNNMNLDIFQILCPYRNRGSGTTSHLNEYMQTEYRDIKRYSSDRRQYDNTVFFHSDKIISTSNKKDQRHSMILANGSMGIINIDKWYPYNKKIYFSDAVNLSAEPMKYLPPPLDDYELAYAITVHKSQGSEFEHTFIVIPQRTALLSKELIYTALTRATKNVTLFVEEAQNDVNPDDNILDYALRRSDIERRLTSTFSEPMPRKIFEPEKGVPVRSKVEYILYNKLKESGVEFEYEKKIKCITPDQSRHIYMKPDFTIIIDGTEYYLEHLGMLDNIGYSKMWNLKRETYKANNLGDRLITTDDLFGIQNECIDKLLDDITNQKLAVTKNSYSYHHYKTYQ